MASKKIKYLVILWVLISLPLVDKVRSLPILLIIFLIFSSFIFIKWPKIGLVILPVLFLLTLYINNFFSPFSFDWEKMVLGNKNFLYSIERLETKDCG